nr:hypothetical protein [Tanacetum cinerariifolium]
MPLFNKSRNKHALTAVNIRNKRTPLAELNSPIWPLTKQTPLFDASAAVVEVVVSVVLLEAVGVVLGGGGDSEGGHGGGSGRWPEIMLAVRWWLPWAAAE